MSEQSKEHTELTELTNNKTSTDTNQWLVQTDEINKESVLETSKDSKTDQYRSKEMEVDIYDRLGNLRATIRSKEQSMRNDTAKEQTGNSNTSSESRKDSVYTRASVVSQTDTNITSVSDKELDSEQSIDIETNKTTNTVGLVKQIVIPIFAIFIIMLSIVAFVPTIIALKKIMYGNKNNK